MTGRRKQDSDDDDTDFKPIRHQRFFMSDAFWERKSLDEMSAAEWESLCDGCARCCLNKVLDEDEGTIVWTSIACDLLDCSACRCSDYDHRSALVPDCVKLTPQGVRELPWLPPTCAYVLVAQGKPLFWWHHLVSGSRHTVHEAGMSVRGRISARESEVALDDYELHAIEWDKS